MRKTALILLILITLCVTSLYAGTTGKIAGKVRDENNKGLAYVNVSVFQNGRRITGGQTKENGTYMIINIPPGEYEVRYQLVGFAQSNVPNLRINVDQTTTQNITLYKQGVVMKTVIVNAQQSKIVKDESGSSRKVNMDKITDVAVNDVEGIVALQAGVSMVGGELHVRGGRANEVNYTIDNMSVSDPVDGGTALQVDPDAISDMKVMTGGFTAEYGNAQSGVVNIITKEGDPYYSGKVEYSSDHIVGDGRNEDAFKFAIGGPVLPFSSEDMRNKFTFYLNGGGDWSDGRLQKYAVGDPNDDFTINGISILENDYPKVDPFAGRKSILGVDKGNRFYNSYNVNFKTKYAIDDLRKITFAARGDRSVNDFFSYLWRYAPDYNGKEEINQKQYVLSYDNVLNDRMNLKIKGSYYQKDYSRGPKGIGRDSYLFSIVDTNPDSVRAHRAQYVQNMLNPDFNYGYSSVGYDTDGNGTYYYWDGFINENLWLYRIPGIEEPQKVEGFLAPGTIYTTFIDDQTSTINTRADFEWQINDIHQAKSGIEIIKHSIKKDQKFNFLTIYEERFTDYLKKIYNMANYVDPTPDDDSTYVPTELVDVFVGEDGAKIPIYYPTDYLNAAYAASGSKDGYKANPWQAAYYLQDKMEWEGMIVNAGLRFDFWYLGGDYQVAKDTVSYVTYQFNKKDRFQMMISPRLGVSHPISDKDVLRFAYNYQNQLPQMQYIFTSKTPEDARYGQVVVGNPTLEPQITVTYEVGLSHQLSEDYVIDMTAYYKNLYNYVSTKKVYKEGETQVSWYEYISEDYGSTRGIDMQLEKSLSDFNSWSIAYSLAWAQGNNSATVIQDDATNLREFPLDWDVRHNMNVNYTFRIARGEEYIVPFTEFILPLDDFSANMTWTIASGAPYTPTTGSQNTPLDTNSKRKKYTQQANLRISKGFALASGPYLRLYMDVENLFKYPNISDVFSKTGSAYDDGEILAEQDDNFTFEERQYMHSKSVIDPANINNFRAVTLGVSFNF